MLNGSNNNKLRSWILKDLNCEIAKGTHLQSACEKCVIKRRLVYFYTSAIIVIRGMKRYEKRNF